MRRKAFSGSLKDTCGLMDSEIQYGYRILSACGYSFYNNP